MSAMISTPEKYFREFEPGRIDLLKNIEKEAQSEGIPIVGPMVGELLYLLASAVNARSILEFGTAVGYSTIFLAQAVKKSGGRVTTWEISKESIQKAKENLTKAGLSDYVNIELGDAVKAIHSMKGAFDLIFIDIEKRDYAALLPGCRQLLRPGGLLVADNVAFADADPFNRAIFNSPHWRSVRLYGFLPDHSPEYDALCLGLRI